MRGILRRRRPAMLIGVAIGAALCLGGLAWGLRPPSGPPADRPLPPLPAAPGQPLRLTVFGTSLTAGSDWPEAAAAALESCLGRPVLLSRVARPGATSVWALQQVERVTATEPDIVVIEFAINDADLQDGLWLSDSIATHLAILRALQTARPETRRVLMTMNPGHGLRGLIRPRLARHYGAYADLAAETESGLVDLYPRWLALPREARGLEDGLHPTDAAARAVILPALVPYLATLAGGACPAS